MFDRTTAAAADRGALASVLTVSSSRDRHEQDAQHAAGLVGEPGTSGRLAVGARPLRAGPGTPLPERTDAAVRAVVAAPGSQLDAGVRAEMAARFGHDFSSVRVHTDPSAHEAARRLRATAWTLGGHIAFAAGHYRPHAVDGRRLIGHELAHVLAQDADGPALRVDRSSSDSGGGNLYTAEQRQEMRTGTVKGRASDVETAGLLGLREGDIVFRLGSRGLAERIGEPVTHGGVYVGGGLIHDMVAFGNRDVRVGDFFAEAEDPSVVKVIRFTGPLHEIIVPRVVSNLRQRRVDLPTDPVPWNLFSSALDYRTATCLEYSHAQFLYAIRQIGLEMVWSAAVHEELRRTYFRDGGNRPEPLIRPRTLKVTGAMGAAVNEMRALIAGADYLAKDVDPTVFQNRWEGRETLTNVGTSWAPTFWQEEILEAFTYRSFADATRFFTVVR